MIKPYYDHGGITIYNCDCREILSELEPVDLVLTDPPYNVTQNEWDKWDAVDVLLDYPLAVFTTGERLLAYLINKAPDRFQYIWVWDRVNKFTDFLNASTRPMRQHELIAVFGEQKNIKFNPIKRNGYTKIRRRLPQRKGNYGSHGPEPNYGDVKTELHPSSIIQFKSGSSREGEHPTQKPVALFRYLAETYLSEIILDPFMGGGTTLVAAKELKRRAIGIEIEEKYCEIAVKKLAQEVLPI